MSDFLTLEDINSVKFNNQGGWWHEVDLSVVPEDNEWIKIDFMSVKKRISRGYAYYTITVNNSYFTGVVRIEKNPYDIGEITILSTRMELNFGTDTPVTLFLYMSPVATFSATHVDYYVGIDNLNLNYGELQVSHEIPLINRESPTTHTTISKKLSVGYNRIDYEHKLTGYVFVNLIKSNFQFNCNQTLTAGKVNTVCLGVDSDYLPSGVMVGEYAPEIYVIYQDKVLPVRFDETLNDYCFDIDLINKNAGNVKFKVIVNVNRVLNSSETDIMLKSEYEMIDSEAKLKQLCANGGTGRLPPNGLTISLTEDLTISKDTVWLPISISSPTIIKLNGHKIIVSENTRFNAENIIFSQGIDTILQLENSEVKLINCDFYDCKGSDNLGGVIKCDIDLNALSNPSDFTTTLIGCSFIKCNSIILHSGELIVENCNVDVNLYDLYYSQIMNSEDIPTKNYPYFLYQTDGNALITNSTFKYNLRMQMPMFSDVGVNPCIFRCGENATINGNDYTKLQNNNISDFLERNNSQIDVSYLYTPINKVITLQSQKGYAHCVTNVDYMFKTNITPVKWRN